MVDYGIGLVTARAGSKGFPGKNVAVIAGKTLLEHATSAGLSSNLLKDVYVSTDSSAYEKIAINAGAQSLGLREKNLALDNSLSIDVVCDFINNFGEDKPKYIVLLQPTSPIRTGKQIDECIKLHLETGQSVVSVAKLDEPHPLKLKTINNDGFLTPYIKDSRSDLPRQTLPEVYQLTGAIYVATTDLLLSSRSFFSNSTVPYITESFSNIDSEEDYEYLKFKLDRQLISV